MYIAQFAGAVQSVGLGTTAEITIIPVHAHADHVNQIVEMIASAASAVEFRIPAAWPRWRR